MIDVSNFCVRCFFFVTKEKASDVVIKIVEVDFFMPATEKEEEVGCVL